MEGFSRSVHSGWFQRWKWLYVKETKTSFVLHMCSAVAKTPINEDRTIADATFVKGGFSNQQKAVEKFREHEKSCLQPEALNKIAALRSTMMNALLSDMVANEQNTVVKVLELTLRSIKY
ncbi:zinc finger MYM-type protein 1-like [Scomber scombrus]|uniref:Zinc finger MYM-type protein 1-like n=1 Tax=Scomber scombrus TaxID=13677 RepID=A0AAV1N5E5_SCOSC